MPDALKQTISATEAPALLNASPYTTRWLLYRRFKTGEESPSKEDNRMNFGKLFEPVLLQCAADEMRFEVQPNRDTDGKQVYVRNGLFGCTRDATIICPDRGPGALETKCCFDYGTWLREWGGGKSPPRHIELQIQTQMKVGDGQTPYKWGVIAVFCGGEMFYFERKPIPALWDKLDEEAARFFDDVKAGREPDPFGSPVEVPLLTECFPLVKGKVLDLSQTAPPSDADGGLVASDEWKRVAKASEDARLLDWHSTERLGHERAEKSLKAQMMALAGDAEEVILLEGIKLKIKQVFRKSYEVKASTYKTVEVYAPGDAI